MSSEPIRIVEQVVIGRNRHGYTFAVGRVDRRWFGYAIGGGGLFVMPGVSEGHEIGLTDRDEAIRRTSAVAQDVHEAYGGIDEWLIPPGELRGDPEVYRCRECGELFCENDPGRHDYDEDWDAYQEG